MAWDSFDTAFANNVFPVPGGPYNKIPLGGLIPNCLNELLYFIGHSTASINCCFISSKPPISFHLMLGISTNTSLIAEGLTIFNAALKSSSVIINLFNKS